MKKGVTKVIYDPKPLEFKFPNGTTIEVFTISVLAFEMGRTIQVIRKWEISGTLPPTCFRDKRGRRLYTAEQIDTIRECAEKSHLAQGKCSIISFSRRVKKAMKKLEKKYIEMGGYNVKENNNKKTVKGDSKE